MRAALLVAATVRFVENLIRGRGKSGDGVASDDECFQCLCSV